MGGFDDKTELFDAREQAQTQSLRCNAMYDKVQNLNQSRIKYGGSLQGGFDHKSR